MAFDTLEQAQERIVELEEQVTTLTTEKESLSQENEVHKNTIEGLRTLNQKYFNKLIAQEQNQENEEHEGKDDVPSCEEFAVQLLTGKETK